MREYWPQNSGFAGASRMGGVGVRDVRQGL